MKQAFARDTSDERSEHSVGGRGEGQREHQEPEEGGLEATQNGEKNINAVQDRASEGQAKARDTSDEHSERGSGGGRGEGKRGQQKPAEEGLGQALQNAVAKLESYGPFGVAYHLSWSCVWLGSIYTAVKSGVDVQVRRMCMSCCF